MVIRLAKEIVVVSGGSARKTVSIMHWNMKGTYYFFFFFEGGSMDLERGLTSLCFCDLPLLGTVGSSWIREHSLCLCPQPV
jgi:hypothetical protein